VRIGTLALLTTVVVLLLAVCAGETEDRVYESPGAVEPLVPGRRVPSIRVVTVGGDPIDLAEQLRDRGALLVFYRGGW
jgi:hypothetical protein